jgi:hypothetical protein
LIARTVRLRELTNLNNEIAALESDLGASEELSIEKILSDTTAMNAQQTNLEREIAALDDELKRRAPASEDDLLAEQRTLTGHIAVLEPEVQALSARVSNLEELRRLGTAKAAERDALAQAAAEAGRLEAQSAEMARACDAAEEELALARQRIGELEGVVAERAVALRAARNEAEFRGKLDAIAHRKAERARLRKQIEGLKARVPRGRGE